MTMLTEFITVVSSLYDLLFKAPADFLVPTLTRSIDETQMRLSHCNQGPRNKSLQCSIYFVSLWTSGSIALNEDVDHLFYLNCFSTLVLDITPNQVPRAYSCNFERLPGIPQSQ